MIEQILEADRYLQVDQVEKARHVYERVVEQDPGNAMAVVGLAQCALAEGHDREAYEQAGRALEIDPENDMARRMEARLSEILATRGEAVERPAAAATPSPREMRPVVTEAGAETHPASAASRLATADAPRADAPSSDAPRADAPRADTATSEPPEPKLARTSPSPSPRKERPMRKSLFDRLLGR